MNDVAETVSRYRTINFTQRFKSGNTDPQEIEALWNQMQGFIFDRCTNAHPGISTQCLQTVVDMVHAKFTSDILGRVRHRRAGSFRAWLFKCINNAYNDVKRKEYRCQNSKAKAFANILLDWDDSLVVYSRRDDRILKMCIAALAFDQVKRKSPPDQVNCFFWRTIKHMPVSKIADFCDLTPRQVSENVRAFGDKIIRRMRKYYNNFNITGDQWEMFYLEAMQAHKRIMAACQEYNTICGKKCTK